MFIKITSTRTVRTKSKMIDIDELMRRDHLVQYLAYYTVTKGSMCPPEFDKIHAMFVQYKQMLRKKECTLEWLAKSVMDKWSVPDDPRPPPSNMITVPIDLFQGLAEFYAEHQSGDTQAPKGPRGADNSTVATDPSTDQDLNFLSKLLGSEKGLPKHFPVKPKQRRQRKNK